MTGPVVDDAVLESSHGGGEGGLPQSRLARIAVEVVGAVFAFLFAVRTAQPRFAGMWGEWSCDPDQRQAIWHYWRYAIDGAFPDGNLLTDYAFVMHAPPGWWLMMAPLSAIVGPLVAAKIWTVVSYFGTAFMAYMATRTKGGPLVAAATVFMLLRQDDFWRITAGGYARSFGPFLVFLFLWAWLSGRHRTTLAVLVLQAALYPSVVIPCGLTYGAYTVLAGPTMKRRLARMAGMTVAGVLVISVGLFQDLKAPSWWGSVVTEAEAIAMPAWGPGGRTHDAPLRPWQNELKKNFTRGFSAGGTQKPPFPALTAFAFSYNCAPLYLFFGLLGTAGVVLARRRKLTMILPWQPLALMGGSLAGYVLARTIAFKLYLPYRVLAHCIPYVLYLLVPLAVAAFVCALLPRRRHLAGAVTLMVVVVVMGVVGGLDFRSKRPTYSSAASLATMYQAIEKMPLTTTFAGELKMLDTIPLFGKRPVYVNRVLTHPFRKGYYDECERRLLANYEAYYANSWDEVIAFADAEGVNAIAINVDHFRGVDPRLFQPVLKKVKRIFNAKKGQPFVLKNPPADAVVFRKGGRYIVDIALLKASLALAQPEQPADDVADIAVDDVADVVDEGADDDGDDD